MAENATHARSVLLDLALDRSLIGRVIEITESRRVCRGVIVEMTADDDMLIITVSQRMDVKWVTGRGIWEPSATDTVSYSGAKDWADAYPQADGTTHIRVPAVWSGNILAPGTPHPPASSNS